ncbi:hypothetical protein GN156_39050, partial [bacterium LRH843]|nr:hypothetical protein [bacterium LRH843]
MIAVVRLDSNRSLFDNIPNVSAIYYDGSYGSLEPAFTNHDIDCVFHLASLVDQRCNAEHITDLIDANIT